MNQIRRWILCAAICCAVPCCNKKPTGPGDPSKSGATTDFEANPPKATTGVSIGMEAPSDVAAPPADAMRTSSGIAYKVLQAGREQGRSARSWDKVEVHYSG